MQKNYSIFGVIATLTVLVFAVMVTPTTASATGSFDFPKFDWGDHKDWDYGDKDSFSGTCKLKANVNEVAAGNSVTLTWETSNFDVVEINGQAVSGATGSVTYENIQQNTSYILTAKTNDGKNTCTSKVTIKCIQPPVVIDCTPGGQHYNPEADLSGSIFDGTKGSVTNSSEYCSYDVGLASYEKFDEIIDNQKIFDYETGTVGPKSSIELAVDVPQCAYQIDLFYGEVLMSLNGQRYGDRILDARHLNGGNGYCGDIPVKPECPFEPKEGRIIVNFNDTRIRSDQGAAQAYSSTVNTVVPAGTYDITLASWDGYVGRENVTQPNEQWKLEFMNDSSVFATSGIIKDVPDMVRQAAVTELVNSNFVIASAVNGLRAAHAFYPDTTSPNSVNPTCAALDKIPEVVPSCDSFIATPAIITLGNSAELKWETTNATRVVINNGVGEVSATGTKVVAPITTTNYELTVFGANNSSVKCEVPVTVTEEKLPVCEYFTASPTVVSANGGTTTLAWGTKDATQVSIAPAVGVVSAIGTQDVFVSSNTTYTLTAVLDGKEVTCPASVTLEPQEESFTCEQNVTFTIDNSSLRRGNSTNLNWNVVDADSVSISVINATAFSGTQSVAPTSDTTYVLTAKKGSKTIQCPVDVSVSGGGGGGSSSPRCELTVSANKIKLGESVRLRWDTTRATEVTIKDNFGNTIFTTEGMLASEKEEYLDDNIEVTPTRDTKYILVASRGSRDADCEVKVEIEDDVVILQTRDQQPLVAGISLSQVPHTGFEAGPFMTFMFYALLVAWALYITYLIVSRQRAVVTESVGTPNEAAMKKAEAVRPDVFVASVSAPVAPTNLPVAQPVIGYENATVDPGMTTINPHHANDALVTEIENRAHAQKALLSSDAVRHFVATTEGSVERNEALDQVISEAKKSYPLEDGWIVINEARMRNLCETCQVYADTTPAVNLAPEVVPQGTGSLAEAIVTGNVVAAYEMIGNRPMFSLADAAADLDAIYRNRQGENKSVSELLKKETAKLSNEQIKSMIEALTSALDGTYTDEASAVKMAIMKAVKAGA